MYVCVCVVGQGASTPHFLRHVGKVQVRELSRPELTAMVSDVWRLRNKDVATTSFGEFFAQYLKNRFGMPQLVAKWARLFSLLFTIVFAGTAYILPCCCCCCEGIFDHVLAPALLVGRRPGNFFPRDHGGTPRGDSRGPTGFDCGACELLPSTRLLGEG